MPETTQAADAKYGQALTKGADLHRETMKGPHISLSQSSISQPFPCQTSIYPLDIPFVCPNASTLFLPTSQNAMRLNTFILPVLPVLALAALQQTQTKTAQPCSDLSCSEPPPDGKVHIRDTQASGSGCPPSSVSIQISKDRQTVTIGMSQMSSYYGFGFTSKDNSHNCAIHTILEYPGNYSRRSSLVLV
jgi:hypothetical protein